jgi:predicted ATP-grasp superfamily ATP-dependent carboligase|tara:strand:+ start:334 stop:570 length:237 start_codon:yes stop_codon:yes gene_type:complete
VGQRKKESQIMEKMVISIIAAALLGLGAWNLNQTFNLSIEIESIKGKIETVETNMKQLRNMIAKDRKNIKKKKDKKDK